MIGIGVRAPAALLRQAAQCAGLRIEAYREVRHLQQLGFHRLPVRKVRPLGAQRFQPLARFEAALRVAQRVHGGIDVGALLGPRGFKRGKVLLPARRPEVRRRIGFVIGQEGLLVHAPGVLGDHQ